MSRISFKKIIILFFCVLAVMGMGRIYFWVRGTRGPSDLALAALRTDENVRVIQELGLITFEKVGITPSTGFIFYPGAGVDFKSYAPILRQIAENGFLVIIPSMPFNIAFLDANAAQRIIASHSEITAWAVGGHSLGGVVAADFAAKNSGIAGVVFWASYPRDSALKTAKIKVLSISASQDGLATRDKIDRSRLQLPADAIYIEIKGGNHAQFGSYGSQTGDKPAEISPEEQANLVAGITSEFLLLFSR